MRFRNNESPGESRGFFFFASRKTSIRSDREEVTLNISRHPRRDARRISRTSRRRTGRKGSRHRSESEGCRKTLKNKSFRDLEKYTICRSCVRLSRRVLRIFRYARHCCRREKMLCCSLIACAYCATFAVRTKGMSCRLRRRKSRDVDEQQGLVCRPSAANVVARTWIRISRVVLRSDAQPCTTANITDFKE